MQQLTLDAAAPDMSFLLPKGRCSAWVRAARSSTARARSIACATARAATGCGRTAAAHRCSGWSEPTAGQCSSISRRAHSTSPARGQVHARATPGPPLDLFVVASRDPAVLMREYARITGLPEMPALWTFGYMQSHRTLAGPDEIMGVARTFREKRLPCDALIYLGTDFTPSGWNTHNGEFTWHPTTFPIPKGMVDKAARPAFQGRAPHRHRRPTLTGPLTEPCTAENAGPSGRTPRATGRRTATPPVTGRITSRSMTSASMAGGRIRATASTPVSLESSPHVLGGHAALPAERAAVRAASQRIRRHAALRSVSLVGGRLLAWETLETHVPVAVNTGLSGIPYWGTDIGGFVPTAGYTGELHVRWFQFGAFCPSSARTGGTGTACRGDGTPATAARRRRTGAPSHPRS